MCMYLMEDVLFLNNVKYRKGVIVCVDNGQNTSTWCTTYLNNRQYAWCDVYNTHVQNTNK